MVIHSTTDTSQTAWFKIPILSFSQSHLRSLFYLFKLMIDLLDYLSMKYFSCIVQKEVVDWHATLTLKPTAV